MDTTGFLLVIATGLCVFLISKMLDILWAQALPVRMLYYILRFPGVVLHECTHMLGCLLTGAKIRNIVFFSKEGGSVTHTAPVIPFVGDVVISTAPLFCIPLVLTLCTWLFSTYLGCFFPDLPLTIDSADTLVIMGGGIFSTFSQNLLTRFNPWFLVYLYLVLSLVLSAAPSTQDLRNAATGYCILAIAGLLILWSQVPWAVGILTGCTRIIGMGFALGLGFGLTALVLSSPLLILYLHRTAP
jgi:hypothetical protein